MEGRASTETQAALPMSGWLAGVSARLRSALAAASAHVKRSSAAPPSDSTPSAGASHQ